MKPSVVIQYYRRAHALFSAFSAFLIKATQISLLTESLVPRLYEFKQATVRNLIIEYSEANTKNTGETKYNRDIRAVMIYEQV